MTLDNEHREFTRASVPLHMGESNASILCPVKGGLLLFLSLHHPNNHLQNISVFICSTSTQLP